MGGEIFRTCPDRPCGTPSLLYNRHRAFPGDKERSGCDADPSTPSRNERVELYLYTPYRQNGLYRASVPVQGCQLPHLIILGQAEISSQNMCSSLRTHSLHRVRTVFCTTLEGWRANINQVDTCSPSEAGNRLPAFLSSAITLQATLKGATTATAHTNIKDWPSERILHHEIGSVMSCTDILWCSDEGTSYEKSPAMCRGTTKQYYVKATKTISNTGPTCRWIP